MGIFQMMCKISRVTVISGVTVLLVACFLLAGCGSSSSKPAQQAQPQQSQAAAPAPAANQNDEKAFKYSCQEMEWRGLTTGYTKYVNKPVKGVGPVTEVQRLTDGRVRAKVKYPDTDALWITSEKALFNEPKVGKRVEFWGIMLGKGEKTKLAEISAKYVNALK